MKVYNLNICFLFNFVSLNLDYVLEVRNEH